MGERDVLSLTNHLQGWCRKLMADGTSLFCTVKGRLTLRFWQGRGFVDDLDRVF
jgi:hypothetical protein